MTPRPSLPTQPECPIFRSPQLLHRPNRGESNLGCFPAGRSSSAGPRVLRASVQVPALLPRWAPGLLRAGHRPPPRRGVCGGVRPRAGISAGGACVSGAVGGSVWRAAGSLPGGGGDGAGSARGGFDTSHVRGACGKHGWEFRRRRWGVGGWKGTVGMI